MVVDNVVVKASSVFGLHFCKPKKGRASVYAAVFVPSSFMGYIFVTRNREERVCAQLCWCSLCSWVTFFVTRKCCG